MSAHVDIDGDCPLAVVPCQYSDIGCKHKVRMVRIVALYLTTDIRSDITLAILLCYLFYKKHDHHSVRVPL